MKLLLSVLLVVFATALASEHRAQYDNYRVYTLNVETIDQATVLQQIEQNHGDFEFWKSAKLGFTADIMVPPHKLADFEELVQLLHIESTLKVENVQALIDNERPNKTRSAETRRDLDWIDYYTYEEIYAWLDVQLATFSNILTPFSVGQTYQGKEIRGVKLSHKAGNPTIFIEANIHAREWITSATATWFLDQLLRSTDPLVRDLAENIDWHIVPVFNVDGFDYTHKTNRLWRKTRQNHATICYGTDANRNFNFQWMSTGASDSPCSETFAGPLAFSEPETQLLANYIATISSSIKIYLAFHSYGQYFLFPWGHTGVHIENYEDLMAIGIKTRDAIAVREGTDYLVGPSSTVLYETSGSSVDYVLATHSNIKLGYTFEFRDRRNGPYGFVLPAEFIVPNGLEILDGIIAMVAEARARGQL